MSSPFKCWFKDWDSTLSLDCEEVNLSELDHK